MTCGFLIAGCAPSAPSTHPAPAGAARAAGATGTGAALLSLPEPSGTHEVGMREFPLIDRDRPDPWKPETGPRRLMTSVWYPTEDEAEPAPYTTPVVSQRITQRYAGEVPPSALTGVDTHAGAGPEAKPGRWPLVVLSPGFSLSRVGMTGLATELASKGYVVVTVDHNYEAPIEFPDGRVSGCARPIPCGKSGDQHFLQQVVENRSLDMSFVLDELTGPDSPWAGSRFIDGSRIGAAGHSLGGASSAALAATDSRVRAGVNMDGTLYAPESLDGVDKPFLLLGSGLRIQQPNLDPSWEQAWPKLNGWKRGLLVEDSGHASFTDDPLWIDQLGIRDAYPPDDPSTIGSIDSKRAMRIMRTYVGSMFDQHLKGEREPILDEPSPEYPEVVFWKNG